MDIRLTSSCGLRPVWRRYGLENAILKTIHKPCRLVTFFMLVAEQMQNTVNQHVREFITTRQTMLVRLALDHLEAKNELTQATRLCRRKTEHVRRLVFVTELSIEATDFARANEYARKLRVLRAIARANP